MVAVHLCARRVCAGASDGGSDVGYPILTITRMVTARSGA